MNTDELLEKAKKEAAEKLKKGAAEGKNSTQIVMETIEQNHGETTEEISALRAKYQRMEESVEDMKRRAVTGSVFGGNKGTVPAFKEQLSHAVGENLQGFENLRSGNIKSLRIETKTVGDMSLGNLTGGTASITGPVVGPVGQTYRLNNVMDLLRQVNIGTSYLPVLRDNGGEGVPAPVAEGAQKPQVDFDLVEANAKSETIAAIAKVSKQFLDDVKNGQTWLVDRLTELYFAAVNDQLLNGNGTTPNLKGLDVAGNFTAGTGSSSVAVELLVQAILQMRILKRRASGIIVNPDILETIILNKAGGSGEYSLPPFVNFTPAGQLTVMGVPCIDVPEQTSGTFTVHDNTGSLLAVRQNVTIEFFDQPLAETNKILVRIESRLAFPVFGASYTIVGSF
jgi:HK97 family phage major capsid protein